MTSGYALSYIKGLIKGYKLGMTHGIFGYVQGVINKC